MLVDVEQRNTPDAYLQELFYVRVHYLAHEFFLKWFKPVIDRGQDRFVCFAFFDALVNAFFDEDALKRTVVEFVQQLLLSQFQFALENGHELRGVFVQYFADGQFDRPVVLDNHDAAGDADFAISESVQGIYHFFRIHTGRAFDFDLNIFRSEIVDGFYFEFALARGVFDGSHERIRRRTRRNFRDNHRGFVFCFDAGTDFDGAFAVLVIARIHQAARCEIREAFKRLLFQDGDLRFQQLGKIVRQNSRA